MEALGIGLFIAFVLGTPPLACWQIRRWACLREQGLEKVIW